MSNWWEEAPLAEAVPASAIQSIKTNDDAWWESAPVVDAAAPTAPPKKRSWIDVGKDTVVQLAEGVNTIAGAVPNLVAPDSSVAGFFRENADSWRAQQSPAMQQKVADADAQIAAADQDSIVDQVVAAAKAYSSDPALAARFVVTNLPSMVPGIGAAKLAQAARLAGGASAAAAAATATTAAGGVNAVMNAGGARGEAFEDVRDTLIAQGRSPEEAASIALDKSLLPAAVGGATGFLSGKVGLERALVGGGVARGGVASGLRSAGAEMLGEQAEELAPQVTTNYQASEFDQRPLSRNIGRTAVETAIASGPSSAVAGVMTGRSTIASERARLEAMRAARVEAEAAVAAQRDQAVADIGAQDSVDGAIAAAGRAANLDSDQLLADALGSVGIDLSELQQADAADAADAQAQASAQAAVVAAADLAAAAPSAEAAQGGAPVNQTAQPSDPSAPVRVWHGRRGDGYATPADAERGLKERVRLQPDLGWVVEQTPDGKYRLAGYAPEAVQQAAATAASPIDLSITDAQVGDGRAVLQNRDRTSAASVALMNDIAARPDYLRTGPSREMQSGAPVVVGEAPASAVPGRSETVVDGRGDRIQAQYMVVEAADLLASNRADGAPNAGYADGAPGVLRAVAGNGRTAGIQAAYERGTANTYRQELLADAQAIGLDQGAMAAMQSPVLVRVMRSEDVRPDMGDRTNISSTQEMSALEQATNDASRINVSRLKFDENGEPTPESIRAFVYRVPVSERGKMQNPDGSHTRQAVDRLMAATFKQAYASDDLVRLYAQATDPEARAVLSALADAAGAMAGMANAGDLDIRQAVADAAKMAVNATRRGVRLAELVQNADLDTSPEAFVVAQFLADNIRSAKRMCDGLRAWAQFAQSQARIAQENQNQSGFFGDQPTVTREQLFQLIGQQDALGAAQSARFADAAGRAERQGADTAAAAAGPADRGLFAQDGPAQEVAQPAPLELTAPTEAGLLAQQEAQEAAGKQQAADEAKAEAAEKAARDAKEVAARMDASADNFTLGQDASDALSGQGNMLDFDMPDERAPARKRRAPETTAFKSWFGDSAVVDADGNPLVMYHGTSATQNGEAFTLFDTYASNYGLMGAGAYFTDNPAVASSYTSKGKGGAPTVYQVYLSIQRPLDMDAKANTALWMRQFPDAEQHLDGGSTNEHWYRAAEEAMADQGLQKWEGAEAMQDGLRAMGFDGIAHVGGGRVKSDGVSHRVYIAFEPEQIKSATGNNGNFDGANPDIRFSFAGQQAATADRMALTTAQERLAAGEDAEAVRQDTGWHKGADGKWRFEISDDEAMVRADTGGREGLRTFSQMFPAHAYDGGITVGNVLWHPKLLAAYPAVADIRLKYGYDMRGTGALGAFNSATNTITLNADATWEGALSTLLHEIQHGIQSIEGFATGGSIEAAADDMPTPQAMNDAKVLAARMKRGDSAFEARQWFMQAMGRDPDPQGAYMAERYDASEIQRLPTSPLEAYRRLAGETEARNTQARQKLTDAQRRATAPGQTADVADADVIVVLNGKKMDSAPAPANAPMTPDLARTILALGRPPARATKESVRAAVRELVNGLGLLPNRLGRVVVATSAEIKQDWEPLIGPTGMEASGGAGQAQGFYDPKSKTVFLIADHIQAGDELGVAAHELMHKHGPAVLGKENWDKLHGAIGGWANAKTDSMERTVYDKAARRVRKSLPDGADVQEYSSQELFPYAAQVALEMGVRPNAMAPQGTVARWLAQVRSALRQAWSKIAGGKGDFNSLDLVNLAFGIAQRENPAHTGELDNALHGEVDSGQAGEKVSFSRASGGFDLPAETWVLKKRRRMQDYFIRVQQVQQAVLEQNGVVDEQTDTYRAEELSHGRSTALLMDFAKNQVDPLMQKMHKAGVELEELSLYAYAMHAPERNAQIARIDVQLQDGGSGMTNADAQAVIDQARQDGKLAQLQDLHADLMGIVHQNRATMLSEGLITQKEFDALQGAYQNYIPLRGFEGVDESGKRTGISAGKGFNIRGPETLRAKGRKSRAGLLVENALADYQRTVVRAERNQVAKVFLNFVMKNPDPDLWEIDALTTRKSIDRATGRIARTTAIDKGEDTIAVKVNGVEIFIRIKDELLLRAMKKAHKDDTGETERFLLRSVGMYTSLLRNTLTRYNPEFAVVNAVRDFGFGSAAMLDVLGERGVAQFVKHYPGAIAASYRQERNTLDPQARDWDKWFTEYKAAGGMTAGFYAKGAEEVAKDLRQVLLTAGAKPRNWQERVTASSPANAAKKALHVLEIAGATSENAARVAAYRTAREMGKTPAQAASIAKNLTTNFDRKGELGQLTNAFYVFFNAAVQGTHRTLKMFASRKVMGYMAGLTAASVGIALASATQGGDDPDDGMAYWDKIPDYVKERNFIIMLPPGAQIEGAEEVGSKGRYVAIPVQYGLNIFHLTGYQIADVLRNQRDKSRGVDLTKAGINLASAVAGSFNPFGGGVDLSNGSSIAQAIAPSLMDPVIQLSTGTNGFGRDVAPFKSPFDTKPDSQGANVRQEGGAYQRVAQWINAATGGDEYDAGGIDLAPGTLENIVRNLTGGAGPFVYDALTLAGKGIEQAMGGDPDVFVRDVPFLRKVYGETAGDVDQGLFYEHSKAISEASGIQKRRADAGLDMTDTKKEAQAEMGKDAAKFSKWLSEVRKEMVEVKKDPEMTEVEKRTRMRELRAERDTLTSEFNKSWMEAMKEWADEEKAR